jgi:quercetin dioxygenase-like cupin family protein
MSKYFVRRDECIQRTLFPGVEAFMMTGEKLMVALVTLEPHSVVQMHSHPHEQLGMLLEGEVTFTIGDQEESLRPGDMWRIPGGVAHRVVTGVQPARALDVFHPVREDYL